MIVGIIRIELHIPLAHSLKEKRKVIQGLIGRARSRHNVSVSEVEYQDLWQRAGIAIAAVGTSKRQMESMFDGILRDVESTSPAQVVGREIEFL